MHLDPSPNHGAQALQPDLELHGGGVIAHRRRCLVTGQSAYPLFHRAENSTCWAGSHPPPISSWSPDWEKPIYVKIGATRPYYDVALAVKSGADVVVLDGMQGGTAATQDVFIEHVGIPILAAIRPAVQALQDLGMHRKVQLIVSGGIRNGADVAKALALGADAVAIGTAALVALGDNDPHWRPNTTRWAPPQAPMMTGTKAATRPGSPRKTRCWPRGSIQSRLAAAWPITSRC